MQDHKTGIDHALLDASNTVLVHILIVFVKPPRSDNTRHTSLDTRLSKSRNNHRCTLLSASSEHWEEFGNAALGSICLFNQVYSDSPPCEQGCKHPEVSGDFDTDVDAVSVGEKAAGDCGTDGEAEEEGCEDNVTGGRGDCLRS